jgi:transcriptional regulator with XRE-family HTH domain
LAAETETTEYTLDKELNEKIGRRVAKYRAYNKLTQEELASDIGCTRGFVSDIERGARCISVETLARISAVTGITPNKLMGL